METLLQSQVQRNFSKETLRELVEVQRELRRVGWCVDRSLAFSAGADRGSPQTTIRRFVPRGWNGFGSVPPLGTVPARAFPPLGTVPPRAFPPLGTVPSPFHPL